MISRSQLRGTLALLLAVTIACPPAQALVSLNDGHDHIYVNTSVGFGWDSNVYANSEAKGDYAMNTSVSAEYSRRAGWIGVNVGTTLVSSRFQDLKDENFDNPNINVELTKQTGRTTGSLTMSAVRSSRADAAVNLRSTSWNYSTGLNFRYPVITIYTLTGQVGYSLVKYSGNSLFPDLATYTASADLIRLFSTERDIMLGYRYRHSETSVDTSNDDHAATIGLSGKLIRGLNGSLRVGYQFRQPRGQYSAGHSPSTYSAWTASGSTTYALNKRMNFTGTLGKDFSTTATDTSVDTTTAALDFQYAYSSHWSLSATISGGDTRFLGETGRLVLNTNPLVLGPNRHDNFVAASVSINYSLNEHLKVAASYAWFKNWSTTPYADFIRSSYNLNLSSRW
ncbi:outer membrane beta-barrel protein [Opitutus sp. ER46]|uniref:outer membrane beta-barrel protein n=1 Tax=Opitutus sp. ER46 TaxID=2161864 RepID=UPI0011B1E073|nr:outer membrane beta-barrel protein [Opitutus sp. ER46]